MSFKNYLKSKLRYLLSVAALAALVSQLLAPILAVKADGPRFNFLAGDYQILEGFNATKGETVWKNPVSGVAGDEFRGSVYYHNGMQNTTATNTKIKVNIPSRTTNAAAKITASISADNAPTVTSTIVDGQIVGLDGLVVNLDRDAEIEFIPGTVKWFPNASTNNPNVLPTPLPSGQTGNEIISGSGINIGNIEGCWPFAGFVTFGFKTKVKQAPAITIDKTVRNVTKGGVNFVKETEANLGDDTEFRVVVTNTGNVNIGDAILRDIDPTGLIFVPGSFQKISGGTVTPISDTQAAIFFDGGITLDTLIPGGSVEFRFKTKVSNPLKAGDIATNKAIVVAAGLTAESTARVKVVAGPVANIVKSKSAFNNTKNKPVSDIAANPGDLITYTLTARNTGTASTDFVIEDDITEVLRFTDVLSISDAGQVFGNIIRWPVAKINPGDQVSRTFQVRVKNLTSNVTFKNVFGNEVVVTVVVPPVVAPNLHIEKLVRNVSTNEANFSKSNQAFAGDTLEYLINFSNTGNGPADQVKFSDTLPPNTQFISGTTRISRNGGAEQTLPDGITGSGITISSIAQGETGFIKFRIITSANLAAGEILTNTAFITSAGKTISDTAQTKIVAKQVTAAAAPTLPVTGSASAASFMITLFAGIIFLYFRYRKIMSSDEAMIINLMLTA